MPNKLRDSFSWMQTEVLQKALAENRFGEDTDKVKKALAEYLKKYPMEMLKGDTPLSPGAKLENPFLIDMMEKHIPDEYQQGIMEENAKNGDFEPFLGAKLFSLEKARLAKEDAIENEIINQKNEVIKQENASKGVNNPLIPLVKREPNSIKIDPNIGAAHGRSAKENAARDAIMTEALKYATSNSDPYGGETFFSDAEEREIMLRRFTEHLDPSDPRRKVAQDLIDDTLKKEVEAAPLDEGFTEANEELNAPSKIGEYRQAYKQDYQGELDRLERKSQNFIERMAPKIAANQAKAFKSSGTRFHSGEENIKQKLIAKNLKQLNKQRGILEQQAEREAMPYLERHISRGLESKKNEVEAKKQAGLHKINQIQAYKGNKTAQDNEVKSYIDDTKRHLYDVKESRQAEAEYKKQQYEKRRKEPLEKVSALVSALGSSPYHLDRRPQAPIPLAPNRIEANRMEGRPDTSSSTTGVLGAGLGGMSGMMAGMDMLKSGAKKKGGRVYRAEGGILRAAIENAYTNKISPLESLNNLERIKALQGSIGSPQALYTGGTPIYRGQDKKPTQSYLGAMAEKPTKTIHRTTPKIAAPRNDVTATNPPPPVSPIAEGARLAKMYSHQEEIEKRAKALETEEKPHWANDLAKGLMTGMSTVPNSPYLNAAAKAGLAGYASTDEAKKHQENKQLKAAELREKVAKEIREEEKDKHKLDVDSRQLDLLEKKNIADAAYHQGHLGMLQSHGALELALKKQQLEQDLKSSKIRVDAAGNPYMTVPDATAASGLKTVPIEGDHAAKASKEEEQFEKWVNGHLLENEALWDFSGNKAKAIYLKRAKESGIPYSEAALHYERGKPLDIIVKEKKSKKENTSPANLIKNSILERAKEIRKHKAGDSVKSKLSKLTQKFEGMKRYG